MTRTEVMSKQDEKNQIAVRLGFRRGDRGTHSSRTMMFSDLGVLLDALGPEATKEDFRYSIIDDNLLAKKTVATRRGAFQRLSELYAFDNDTPIFRIFRQFWDYTEEGRSLLALLCAAARDPLLRCTARVVLDTPVGEVVEKKVIITALREGTGERFNDNLLDKIARNAASSWTQSGHLSGRNTKIRQKPAVTPANAAYALFLGFLEGVRGPSLCDTLWTHMLAAPASTISDLAIEASRRRWIAYRQIGQVMEVTFPGLLTEEEKELIREQG